MYRILFGNLLIYLFLAINIVNAQKVTSYSVTFKIKNLGTTVNGSFKTGTVKINIDKSNLSLSKFEGTVDINSINTGIKLRDRHLREKDEFFNEANYPKAYMKSVAVESKGNGSYLVTWDLTIKGVTRRLKTTVTSSTQHNITTFKTEMNINRNEWNIGGKSMTMGDAVTITLLASVQN